MAECAGRLRARAPAAPVRLDPDPEGDAAHVRPRALPAARRRAARRDPGPRAHDGHHRRLPRRDRSGLPGDARGRRGSALRRRIHVRLLAAAGNGGGNDARSGPGRGQARADRAARRGRPAHRAGAEQRADRPRRGGARRGAEPHRPGGAPRPDPAQHHGQLRRVEPRRASSWTSGSRVRRRRPSEAQSSPPLLRSRDLTWDGLLNVRDLGGHTTEDGGETRYGSDRARRQRPPADRGRLAMRSSTTASAQSSTCAWTRSCDGDPPPEAPVDVLHVPFFDDDKREWQEIERGRGGCRGRTRRRGGNARRVPHLPRALQERTSPRRFAAVARARPRAASSCTAWAARTAQGSSSPCCSTSPASTPSRSPPTTRSARSASVPAMSVWFAEAETEAERERLERDRADSRRIDRRRLRGARAPVRKRRGLPARTPAQATSDLARARARLRD